MSDHSRSVPLEQLPSGHLHPPPMPVINLGHLLLEAHTRSRVVGDIATACRHLGCFQGSISQERNITFLPEESSILQVINHGIGQPVMDGAIEAASDFFKLPNEMKEKFASDDLRRPVRYDTSSKDGISMSRAYLKHYAHPLSDWVQYWPEKPYIYREHMGNFAVQVRRVALLLMEAILEGLGLGKDYQHEKFEKGLQLLSVNCYPKEEVEGDRAIGLAPHSDYGFLTILLTSCQGLEVMDSNTNSWKAVQQLPHALHVHVGDYMEVLSNGRLKTLVHRALLNPQEERISIASIHGFALHEEVSCAKELVDEQNPQMYNRNSFNDFLDHLTSNLDNKDRNYLESIRMSGA